MIRVGLVGVGAMGSGHLANYLRLMKEGHDVKLVAACDIRPEQLERKENSDLNIEIKREEFEAEYNKYTDFREMMDKEEMDYIDFAVPTYLHAKMAIAAMERGFHVLSEKPMALTVDECERMIETSMRTERTLMVAQCLRFWPAYEELKRLVESGEWGKVISGMFFRGGATPKWSFEDWLRKKDKSGGAAGSARARCGHHPVALWHAGLRFHQRGQRRGGQRVRRGLYQLPLRGRQGDQRHGRLDHQWGRLWL